MALSIADIGEREQGAKYKRDYLIASCLLHDVSKAVEVEPDPNAPKSGGKVVAAKKSEIGVKLQPLRRRDLESVRPCGLWQSGPTCVCNL
jgi:hypothetical protein